MRILVVDDEAAVRFALSELLESEGHEVEAVEHAPAALAALEQSHRDLIILDLRLPKVDGLQLLEMLREGNPDALVIMVTGHGDERIAVQALKRGAYDYVPKPFDNDELRAAVARAREVLALRAENRKLREELSGSAHGIIGSAPALREVYRRIRLVAPTDATVLITGESGTGKDLVARAIHEESLRKARPFVALNCAAIPGELVEGELFGHMRGSFTGAVRDREGLFEAAHTGTLFLDEIGELAASAQAKLLRALENRIITRLGATKPVAVDVRVIAATNRTLTDMVRDGRFREDLYYRLNVVTVDLPPLRDRREDIPALAAHFIAEFATRHKRRVSALSEPARRALIAYDWPGNVRQLRNVLERAVILAEGAELDVGDLGGGLNGHGYLGPIDAALAELPLHEARDRAIAEFDREFITAALERHGGNVSQTARALGIHRQSLQRMMRRASNGSHSPDAE